MQKGEPQDRVSPFGVVIQPRQCVAVESVLMVAAESVAAAAVLSVIVSAAGVSVAAGVSSAF